jgi:hypothetical protein
MPAATGHGPQVTSIVGRSHSRRAFGALTDTDGHRRMMVRTSMILPGPFPAGIPKAINAPLEFGVKRG